MKLLTQFIKSTVILFVLTILCPGCAHIYDGFQVVSMDSCHQLPYSEQQGCLEQVRSTYEAYEQEKKASTSMEE